MKPLRLFIAGTILLVANGAGAQSVVKPFHLDEATIELITPDLDSGKITSDISVHLCEFKPAINSYLVSGNAPVNSLQEIISSGKFHPNIGDNIKKAQSLEMDDGYRLRLQKRSELTAACHEDHG